jgi:hypothetical protein
MDTIFPPVPYGFKNTIAWIQEVTGFFNISLDGVVWWDAYFQPRIKRWNDLIQKAQHYRIGFIVSPREIEALIAENKFPHGVHILELLEEMGFRIEVAVRAAQDSFSSMREQVLSCFNVPAVHTVTLLEDADDIDDFIDTSSCHCFYSDIYYDTRIIMNGKNAFSSFIFEKGFEGAIRSLEKLLNLCETSFFNEYKEYNGTVLRPIIEEPA